MVLLHPLNGSAPTHGLTIIQAERAVCRFTVIAVGPEVRDVQPQDIVLANRLAGTSIGDELLLPESAILGSL